MIMKPGYVDILKMSPNIKCNNQSINKIFLNESRISQYPIYFYKRNLCKKTRLNSDKFQVL